MTQRVHEHINESRVIDRICDITVYGVLSMRCVKNDELRCHVIRMSRRNSSRPATEKNLEMRVHRSVYLSRFSGKMWPTTGKNVESQGKERLRVSELSVTRNGYKEICHEDMTM